MSQRTDRLDSQIQQELMQLLQREMKDPRLGFATITRVETARDLGHARVWVSVLRAPMRSATASIEALRDRHAVAAPPARRAAARCATSRSSVIRHDDSIESGDRVLRILREIEDDEPPTKDGS